jgi:hypothetical protein
MQSIWRKRANKGLLAPASCSLSFFFCAHLMDTQVYEFEAGSWHRL